MSTGQKTEKIRQDVQHLKHRNNFDYQLERSKHFNSSKSVNNPYWPIACDELSKSFSGSHVIVYC